MDFQCISWYAEDVSLEEDYDSDDINVELQYRISIYGRDSKKNSICVHTNFDPFFFIEVPDYWNTNHKDALYSKLSNSLGSLSYSIKSLSFVNRKKFYGFTNFKEFKFIRIMFTTHKAFKRASWIFKKPLKLASGSYKFTTFESNFDPMLRFAHIQHIKMAGWVSLSEFTLVENSSQYVSFEYFVPNWRKINYSDNPTVAPIIQASFDIETYSYDGGFPDPNDNSCPVIQIATTFQYAGDISPYKRVLLSLGSCDNIESAEVICFSNEHDLLIAWTHLIRDNDVDILIGYNIWGFDLWYLYTRAVICDAEHFFELGRKINHDSTLTNTSFSSGAYGDSDFKMVDTIGRFQIDLLVIMKREHKLTSYSLNSVSEHFLKDKKLDMPYKEMFKKYKGTSADRAEIAEYCVKDTDLPLALINKLAILPNMIEMSKATWVPMSFLIERGQGIKVFSQILYQTRQEDMLVETVNRDANDQFDEEKYEGATVLAAKSGAYMDTPITGLDFASLYPTIMRAHKLCHSTYLRDEDKGAFNNIDGIEYKDVIVGNTTHRFAQNSEGILPKMLRILAQNRKQAKKDMAAADKAGDKFMKAVYNGKQLAFKVSMNSIYGFCGANVGFLPCKAVASSTTCIGREMIEHTKNCVEEWYPGANVVYGDSVTPDTAIIVKNNNTISIMRIDELSSNYIARPDGKEYAQCNISVWTETGFTPINQIIRHKTTKHMYRVLTHTGIVDCTEDHSLLSPNAEKLTPSDVSINTPLLHNDPSYMFKESVQDISVEEALVMGFFVGDGSCGKYGYKYTWALNNANIDILITMQQNCPFETKLIDTLSSSRVYKLIAIGNVKSQCIKYRNLFYNSNKEKIIPSCILNSSIDVLTAFWNGYYMADGDKDNMGYTRCDIKGKSGASGLFVIGRRLGYNVSINTRNDKPDIFRLTFTKNYQRKDPTKIKKIIPMGFTTDYVYDLSTEHGHFHVGPGNMIVHNTDSVMVQFNTGDLRGKDAIEMSFKLGEEAADKISATFKDPIELEFEKVYLPYLLFSKKRYAGLMYTNPSKPDYIDAKGIQLVRRDNCPFVKQVSQNVLNTIMYELDTNKAIDLVKTAANKLLNYEVSVDDLVVSKSLKRVYYVKSKKEISADSTYIDCGSFYLVHTYKSSNQPHITVAKKLESRESGTGPKSGDRVPYVFIDTGNSKDLQYTKAEHPSYVKEHNLKIDVIYYLEHALKSPLEGLFSLFLHEKTSDILFSDAKNIFHLRQYQPVDIFKFLGL